MNKTDLETIKQAYPHLNWQLEGQCINAELVPYSLVINIYLKGEEYNVEGIYRLDNGWLCDNRAADSNLIQAVKEGIGQMTNFLYKALNALVDGPYVYTSSEVGQFSAIGVKEHQVLPYENPHTYESLEHVAYAIVGNDMDGGRTADELLQQTKVYRLIPVPVEEYRSLVEKEVKEQAEEDD